MRVMRVGVKRVLAIATLMVVSLQGVGCGPKNAKAVWNDGLKKCAQNDLLGPQVFYFGPSNALGPGTIFQKFADGGIQVSHLLSQYGSVDLYAPAQTFSCDATSSSSFKLSGSATLPSVIPVKGTVSGSLSTAKSVTVSAQALEWDQLVTGPYKAKVLGLPDTDPVKTDLLSSHQLVLSRALKVKGMTAVLEFTDSAGAAAKLQIPGGSIPKAGNVGVDLNATWNGNTKLTLNAPADFYIAGELRTFDVNGLAGPGSEVGPLVKDAGTLRLK
jgi:hypothetical protein